MDSPSSFEQIIEADMKTLATEINRSQEMKDIKNSEGVDAVKEAIRAFPRFESNAVAANGAPTVAAPTGSTVIQSPLPAYAESASPEVKLEIEYLLSLAFQKGVSAAITEADKSSDFVQDAFHDALAGRLYPELQKRGYLK